MSVGAKSAERFAGGTGHRGAPPVTAIFQRTCVYGTTPYASGLHKRAGWREFLDCRI